MSIVLNECLLFRDLNDSEIAVIEKNGQVLNVEKGYTLITEGSKNTWLFLVLHGEVEVLLPDNPQRLGKLVLGSLKTGDMIGEYSFMDQLPSAATVTTLEPSSVFAISHASLNKIIKHNDRLGKFVYRNILLSSIRRLRAIDAELDLCHV